MANDERQSETFIREVDEELRRDQLTQLWMRYAPYFIGVCILIVAVTAGYRGWMWWEERKAAQAGDRFIHAVETISTGDKAAGEAELQKIMGEGGVGYSVLARFRLAGDKAEAGQKAEALAAYDAVASDASVPSSLRDFARVRAALLTLDTGDIAGAKQRAEPLNVAGNPWLHQAREIIATADYQSGDLPAARAIFADMQQDAQTPPDLWIRAGLMVSLIDGQLAAPADAGPAPTTGATPATPPAAAQDQSGASSTPSASTTPAPAAPAPATPTPATPTTP